MRCWRRCRWGRRARQAACRCQTCSRANCRQAALGGAAPGETWLVFVLLWFVLPRLRPGLPAAPALLPAPAALGWLLASGSGSLLPPPTAAPLPHAGDPARGSRPARVGLPLAEQPILPHHAGVAGGTGGRAGSELHSLCPYPGLPSTMPSPLPRTFPCHCPTCPTPLAMHTHAPPPPPSRATCRSLGATTTRATRGGTAPPCGTRTSSSWWRTPWRRCAVVAVPRCAALWLLGRAVCPSAPSSLPQTRTRALHHRQLCKHPAITHLIQHHIHLASSTMALLTSSTSAHRRSLWTSGSATRP